MLRRALPFAVSVCLVAAPGAAPRQNPPTPPLQPLPVNQIEDGRRQPPRQGDPLPVTRIDEQRRENLLEGPPFSIGFSVPQPLKDVLVLLVRGTKVSIVVDPGITTKFVGELNSVTLRQALDAIVRQNGLDYTFDGSVIHVFTVRVETRTFTIDYVSTRRGDADLFGDIVSTVRATLISAEGRVSLDRKAAVLQVTDYPERLDRVANYLESVLLRANRQVQIQARVIEVELPDASPAGIRWGAVLDQAGAGVRVSQRVAPGPMGLFTGTLTIIDLQALLGALGTQGKVTVIASPRVSAMNNEPAVMRAVTVAPNSPAEGLTLIVTPQISADGIVTMSISPRVTERTGQVTTRLGDTVPIVHVRESDTLVRVRQGETIVIAGLTQDRVVVDNSNRRSPTTATRKTDLVILLTPTLMTMSGSADGAGR